MKDLPTLNNDPDGELTHTDMGKMENLVCKDHDLSIDFGKREAHCKKCGYGFSFQIHEMEYDGKNLVKKGENLTK